MNIWYSYCLNSCMWTFSYLPKGDPMWKIASTSESSLCRQTIFFQPLKKYAAPYQSLFTVITSYLCCNLLVFTLSLSYTSTSFLHSKTHVFAPMLRCTNISTQLKILKLHNMHKHINTAEDSIWCPPSTHTHTYNPLYP